MCRLALMNQQAVMLLGKELDVLFVHLEKKLGGDGNGIGLLYDSGRVKVRKGVNFQATHAAGEIRFAAKCGLSWAMFHTRLATTSRVAAKFCHPFEQGKLVLAHNGHDDLFARLGALVGKSDSAYIARTWATRHLPLEALQQRCGVFLGFHEGHPFVVKGQPAKDLVLAYHNETGALLFASQLPDELHARFDGCIQIGKFIWQGELLDLDAIERCPPPSSQQKGASTAKAAVPKALSVV
jgi:hypothetical protein